MNGLLLAASLVGYNNALNLWASFNRALYVPVNLSATVVLLVLGFGPLGLDSESVGLGADWLTDSLVGLGIGAAITAPLIIASAHARTARFIADNRVAGLSNPQLAYQVLLRVPFGTVLLEEVAFRGVLFALWRAHGTWDAAMWSSIAFGLWHVTPTLNLMRANRPGASRLAVWSAVAGALVFTTAAGLTLVWLRVETGGLAAPIALHATVNGLGTLAAAAATRRT